MNYKSFMKAVEAELAVKSGSELKKLFLELASKTEPGMRKQFLENLHCDESIADSLDKTLAALEELKSRIENGDFSEGWGWDPDYCEEREWGDESWAEEIDDFFSEAHYYYSEAAYKEAKTLYEKLFDTLDAGLDNGTLPGPPDPLSTMNTDLDEANFTLIRINYLTSKGSLRPDLLYQAAIDNSCLWNNENGFLAGILAVDKSPMPGFYGFLAKWVELNKSIYSAASDILLREAVMLLDGSEGVEEYAEKLGETRPFFWIDTLKIYAQKSDFNKVRELSLKALKIVNPNYTVCSEICDYLSTAAAKLKDDRLLLFAARNAFYSDPSLKRLLLLASLATDNFDPLMQEACERADDLYANSIRRNRQIHTPLGTNTGISDFELAWSLVFSSQFDKLICVCAEDQSAIFEKSTSGVAVPILLLVIAKKKHNSLLTLLENALPFYYSKSDLKLLLSSLEPVLNQNLPAVKQQEYFSWCSSIVEKKVQKIVSDQNRGSYNLAALLASSIAETISEMESDSAAQNYLLEWKNKFLRYTAFRRELKHFASKSKNPAISNFTGKL
ncbi:MAG: hypothetical protein K8S62_06515 [Candidatus Sabulitectum sp.]|nr:hypothetical protein [Candidatus Sabulitectum sp.]